MAAPLFGYIVTTQVSFLIVQNVANAASNHVSFDSFSTYTYAWMLFQLPYAVVGVSVITALLPRMSAHAAERQFGLVRADFSTGVRLSSAVVVPAALLLIVLGGPLAEFLFGIAHGSTTVAQNRYIGEVFGAFSLFLVPYMMFQLLLRVFYALHDSRTPMYIGVVTMIVNGGASILALYLLPAGHVVEGLGVTFGLGNLAGAIVAWRIASRRLGGLAGHADQPHPGADAPGRAARPAVRLGGHLHGRRAAVGRSGLRAVHGRAGRRRRAVPVLPVLPGTACERSHRPARQRAGPAGPVRWKLQE